MAARMTRPRVTSVAGLEATVSAPRFATFATARRTGRSQLDREPARTELHERRLHRDLSD